ncbi:hypothetical protein [Aestuariivivens marinum]|uniref:hypothetical protein n=1 Tax=Aestuariivivens marinum TaxID=2913555 RepID=UPI001F59D424|nr:hypothetical protein [Aestuariivivens marinum]
MKREIIFKCFLFFSAIFLLNSCDESDDSISEEVVVKWQEKTRIAFTPVEDKETFIWYYDLLTKEEYWGNDEVEINMSIKSNVSTDNFSKVDFYLTVEEKDGYNYTAPFNTTGKMIGSVNVPESGEFTFNINADDAYGLYLNDFKNSRSSVLAREGDIFLLYYVITAKDGTTFDSRQSIKVGNRFGMKVKVEDYAPPVWEGTFDFEWIVVSGGAEQWGGVYVGKTGSVNITHLGNQVYSMSNLLWDYYYGGPGKLYFNFLSGETYVEGNYSEHWTISNINGPSMDIEFWYTYSDAYDETGTVRFTRTDGADWPSNIYSRPR